MAFGRHQYWLMKSEPDCYSIHDLARDTTEMWDGVRNYQARNMLRDEMRIGDRALFYHSNAGKETGVAGTMTITREGCPDPTQFDPKSEHPDPKSDPENPRWYAVDVMHEKTFPRTVTLQELKQDHTLQNLQILKRGNRLSITPVTKAEFERMCALAEA